MEFTIHGTKTTPNLFHTLFPFDCDVISFLGDSKTNLKRGKNNINKTIGNSILEHGDFIGHLEEDDISNKSYGSHKHRFKEESHKGSADDFDDHEEKRDASKEELGIEEGQ